MQKRVDFPLPDNWPIEGESEILLSQLGVLCVQCRARIVIKEIELVSYEEAELLKG